MEEQSVPPPRPARPPRQVPRTLETSRTEDLTKIRQFHDESYLYISQGITCEENGKKDQAITLYHRGLLLIDKALEIRCTGQGCDGERWQQAALWQEKMKKTRKEILVRIADMQAAPIPPHPQPPPSYEEYLQTQQQHPQNVSIPEYPNLDEALLEIAAEVSDNAIPADAEEIFSIPDNVQIFYVTASGEVSAPSYPSSLKIYRFCGESASPACLVVGEWTYPLLPGKSPALHSRYGTYMFPDVHQPEQDAAVGLILPSDLDETVRALFEDLLCGFTLLVEQPLVTPTEPQLSERISQGAEVLAKGLVKGAECASYYISVGSEKLVKEMAPQDQPSKIDPRVQKGMEVAKSVTGGAVKVSSFLVSKVGAATMALGRYLAPHIQKQGSSLLSKSTSIDQKDATKKMDAMLEVASGAVKGFGTVYMGLEESAKKIASSLASNTVTIVHHKYGGEASELTGNTLYTVGNVALAGHNMNALGAKGIAKRVAKDAGKAVIENYDKKRQNNIPTEEEEDEDEDVKLDNKSLEKKC